MLALRFREERETTDPSLKRLNPSIEKVRLVLPEAANSFSIRKSKINRSSVRKASISPNATSFAEMVRVIPSPGFTFTTYGIGYPSRP